MLEKVGESVVERPSAYITGLERAAHLQRAPLQPHSSYALPPRRITPSAAAPQGQSGREHFVSAGSPCDQAEFASFTTIWCTVGALTRK